MVALLGTGILTVALALLAYDLAGSSAGAVLGTALTIKIATYVLVSPLATTLTERVHPRTVMVTADLSRVAIASMLPFVDAVWQVYVLILLLQSASAAFTPTFQAVIPTVLPDEEDYTRALSWSRVAYDMESLVSPAIAGALLAIMTFHDLFFATAAGFLGSATLVMSVAVPQRPHSGTDASFLNRLTGGVRTFVSRPRLRALLALDVVVAAATALVLVNTVVLARDTFDRGEQSVVVALACYGAGSIVTALVLPRLLRHVGDRTLMLVAAAVTAVTVGAAAVVAASEPAGGWVMLLALWAALGILAALVSVPSSRLVVRQSTDGDRQSMLTAQFSLSHACYLLTYPLAGWAGSELGQGWAALLLAVVAAVGCALAIRAWPRDGGGGDTTSAESAPH